MLQADMNCATGPQTCSWNSNTLHKECDREVFGESAYCLFHKPDKNEFEARVFWKIINWQWKTDRLLPHWQLGVSPNEDQKRKYWEIHRRLEAEEIEGNYTESDEAYPQYEDLRGCVAKLLLTRDLGRASNFRVAFFDGFVFPSGADEEFRFKTYGQGANWPMHFRECTFQGGVFFAQYDFTSDVTFRDVTFEQWASFYQAQFSGRVILENVTVRMGLQGFGLFERTRFFGPSVELKNIQPFHQLDLRNADFGIGTRLIDKGNSFERSPGTASYGREFHSVARRVALANGDLDRAGSHYFLERVYKRQEMKLPVTGVAKKIKKHIALIWDWLIAWTCGYGEKPWRSVLFSVGMVLAFAATFWFAENSISGTIACGEALAHSIGDALFTSAFTFTSLGYGDVSEASFAIKLLSIAESALGLVMIAVGTGTLLRKMIR